MAPIPLVYPFSEHRNQPALTPPLFRLLGTHPAGIFPTASIMRDEWRLFDAGHRLGHGSQ